MRVINLGGRELTLYYKPSHRREIERRCAASGEKRRRLEQIILNDELFEDQLSFILVGVSERNHPKVTFDELERLYDKHIEEGGNFRSLLHRCVAEAGTAGLFQGIAGADRAAWARKWDELADKLEADSSGEPGKA